MSAPRAFAVDNRKRAYIIPFVSQSIAEEFSLTSDLAILNGHLWTGNKSQPVVEALASRGERLVAVGSNDDVKKLIGPQTLIIDLKGKLALPGFIDSHTHFVEAGFHLLSVDLRDAKTPEEFARRIGNYAAKLPAGSWITGGDWDHERWAGAALPTKQLIDFFTPEHPVFVSRLDGHMGLANTTALRITSIERETEDPPGGTIVRDPNTGEPTGILKDDAQGLVWRAIPEPSGAQRDAALKASLAEAARFGVTSIQDITPWQDYEAFKRFRDAELLTVRVYARTPMSQWKRQADAVAHEGAGDDWLRLGGLKAFMDGSLGSTTALFFAPFDDAPHTSGLMVDDNIPEGKLRQNIRDADKAGLQCSIHAIGDKANNIALNYLDEVAKMNGPRDRRFRIEHAQHLIPADVSRFGELGVIASMQPYHAIDDGRWAERRLGPVRSRSSYVFRSLLDSGAKLVFGSDWYVAPLSPILGIHAAVTRQVIDGQDSWLPEQRITVEEAVRAYTVSAAYAEFGEESKGSLEVGKLADVVVLSQDIFLIDPEEIRETSVIHTIVGGKVVDAERSEYRL